MLLLPTLTGIAAAHTLTTVPIAIAWVIGYFCFFAAGLWLKARNAKRKAEYFRPMAVYGAIAALAALAAVIMQPTLLWWSCAFAPLVMVAVVETWRRRPRSLASGTSTTIASALMFPVMLSTSPGALTPEGWFATAVMAAYFTGTIFYVKTMIREKGNATFYRESVGFHALACIVAVVGWLLPVSFATATLSALVLSLALVRAALVPKHEKTQAWSPKQVGLWELPLCLGVAAVALLA